VFLLIIFYQFLKAVRPGKKLGKVEKNLTLTTKDGVDIACKFIDKKNAKATIIIGHGYPFDKTQFYRDMSFLKSYNLLFYDHRYFGQSKGCFSSIGIKEPLDVEACIDFADRLGKPVFLFGFSLSASSMLRVKKKVKGIIADSPYSCLIDVINSNYSFLGIFRYPFVWTTELMARLFFGQWPRKVCPSVSAKSKKIPIFLIHGQKDTFFPVKKVAEFKHKNVETWIVKDAKHVEAHLVSKEKYQKKILQFIKKNI